MERMDIENRRPTLWLDSNITYAQVDGWYGHTTKELKMDIIYPNEMQASSWPCIIWLCGGAWMQLDHHAHLPNLIELAREKFVVVSVEYRESNAAQYPSPIEDINKAIDYLIAKCDKYGIDINRMGVMGESAGGYLAAMVGLSNEKIKRVCTWYMPSDLTTNELNNDRYLDLMPVQRFLGQFDKLSNIAEKASPIKNITSTSPPFLLIHGNADTIVPYEQSIKMHEALIKSEIPSDLIIINNAIHGDVKFYQQEIMDKIIRFFNKM